MDFRTARGISRMAEDRIFRAVNGNIPEGRNPGGPKKHWFDSFSSRKRYQPKWKKIRIRFLITLKRNMLLYCDIFKYSVGQFV
jgi:hypothetical protein